MICIYEKGCGFGFGASLFKVIDYRQHIQARLLTPMLTTGAFSIAAKKKNALYSCVTHCIMAPPVSTHVGPGQGRVVVRTPRHAALGLNLKRPSICEHLSEHDAKALICSIKHLKSL
jgi:hypothetical protein